MTLYMYIISTDILLQRCFNQTVSFLSSGFKLVWLHEANVAEAKVAKVHRRLMKEETNQINQINNVFRISLKLMRNQWQMKKVECLVKQN